MDTTTTSNVENADQITYSESNRADENIPSMEKLEAMVTPEQVHSATVAKKRRTITRKRTNDLNKARSQTPMRGLVAADETSTDDENNAQQRKAEERKKRPRTPDRKRANERVVSSNRVKKTNEQNETHEVVKNLNQNAEEEKSDGTGKDVPPKKIQPQKLAELPHDEEKCEPTDGTGKDVPPKKIQPQKLAEVPPEELDDVPKEPSTGETLKKTLPQKIADVPLEDIEGVLDEQVFLTQLPTLRDNLEVIPNKTEPQPEPVQRRSKSKKSDSASASNSERQSIISEHGQHNRASSLPRQLEEQIQKLDNFVTTNTQELIHLFHRAKSNVEEKGKELRRRKFKKNEEPKRSQSQPKQLTETDVLESFKQAQKATAEREQQRLRSSSARRYSSGSEKSQSPKRLEPKRPTRKRVFVQDIIKQKKREEKKIHANLKDKVKCNKIVEVLDPKTSKVIEVKTIGDVARMRYFDVFKIFRYYSLRQIFKQYGKYKVDMSEEYNIIRRLRRKCINHLLILIIFCGLGGIMFKFIEGAFEDFYKCGVKRVKRDFVDLLWVKSHNLREEEWKSLARNRLRIFEEELHNAHEAGVHSYSGQRSWSFLNGIVYCITVVTTIGYGHLYPTTKTGQALTIVYSLIGIPLFLIILTDFGKLFTRCLKFLWSFLRRLYYTGSCRSIRKTTHAQEIFKGAQMMYEIATFRRPSAFDPNMMQYGAGSPHESNEGTTAPPTPAISNFEIDDEFNLPISVAILLLVLYIFLGAVLFGIWEGWDFFASFYFVFISMSTIGFGDYVPRHPIFMIVSIVYLVFGLALMSMCINVVQVKLSDTFSQASAKIGATIGLGVASEDGTINPVPPKSVEMPSVHGSIIELDDISPNTSTKT